MPCSCGHVQAERLLEEEQLAAKAAAAELERVAAEEAEREAAATTEQMRAMEAEAARLVADAELKRLAAAEFVSDRARLVLERKKEAKELAIKAAKSISDN